MASPFCSAWVAVYRGGPEGDQHGSPRADRTEGGRRGWGLGPPDADLAGRWGGEWAGGRSRGPVRAAYAAVWRDGFPGWPLPEAFSLRGVVRRVRRRWRVEVS